jgi:predicted transcriptional regulator of viral defense system
MLPGMGHPTDVNRRMGEQRKSRGVDARVGEIAERQHGVIALEQLLELGLRKDSIHSRVRAGRLIRLHRGVYAVGHRNRAWSSIWMAATLAAGPGAVLSHRPAGAAWTIVSSAGRPEVTAPRQLRPRPTILFHHATVPPDERTTRDGIPITTVPRTLLDLAGVLGERQLERAINEAEVKRLWDELSLHDLLHRHPRRMGTRNLRAALAKRIAGATFTRSELEELAIVFADTSGLPRPETNVYVEGIEVDCVWRPQRVIMEVDGWETHRTRAAFERDREKSRVLQAAGWAYVPVTSLQLKRVSQEVARDVRRLLARATLTA